MNFADFETGRVTHEDVEEDQREVGERPWYKQILSWIF